MFYFKSELFIEIYHVILNGISRKSCVLNHSNRYKVEKEIVIYQNKRYRLYFFYRRMMMSFILCSCQKLFVIEDFITSKHLSRELQESISVSLSDNNVWECCILYKNIKSKEADLSHSCLQSLRLKVFSVLSRTYSKRNLPNRPFSHSESLRDSYSEQIYSFSSSFQILIITESNPKTKTSRKTLLMLTNRTKTVSPGLCILKTTRQEITIK